MVLMPTSISIELETKKNLSLREDLILSLYFLDFDAKHPRLGRLCNMSVQMICKKKKKKLRLEED